jgi:hypothetical protein
LNKADKHRLAVELVKAVLPREDSINQPAGLESLLAREWTGEDFGYQLGADPAKNTAALGKYHEWAEKQGK